MNPMIKNSEKQFVIRYFFPVALLFVPLMLMGQLSIGTAFEGGWASVKDAGYSPLKHKGPNLGGGLFFTLDRSKKVETFRFLYQFSNARPISERRMRVHHFQMEFGTYYPIPEHPWGLEWGWSNNNFLNFRMKDGFPNFNGRSNYLTSFGPSVRWGKPFTLWGVPLKWEGSSHLQLIGFHISSGFVSSAPEGWQGDGFFEDSFRSMQWFYVGKDWNFECLTGFSHAFNERVSIALQYSFRYFSIQGAHQSVSAMDGLNLQIISRL